jgi:hypothetical protein
VDQRVVRDRVDVEVGDLRPLGVVDRLAVLQVGQVLDLLEPLAGLDRVDQLLEGQLPLAADHEVGVLETLLGQKARMRPPRTAMPGPRTLSASRWPGGRGGDGGDAHQIRGEDLGHVDVLMSSMYTRTS